MKFMPQLKVIMATYTSKLQGNNWQELFSSPNKSQPVLSGTQVTIQSKIEYIQQCVHSSLGQATTMNTSEGSKRCPSCLLGKHDNYHGLQRTPEAADT
jgi:hypothetical protein